VADALNLQLYYSWCQQLMHNDVRYIPCKQQSTQCFTVWIL